MINYSRLGTVYIFALMLCVLACSDTKHNLYKIEAERIEINGDLVTNTDIETYILPYRTHIQNDLDSTLAYAKATYNKTDGELNTAIGNLMADLIYKEANPIFKTRTGNAIDVVLLNHGGIRAEIPKGKVSARTAYNVMPFENEIVVVALKGDRFKSIIDFLIRKRRAHPISGLKIVLNKDFELVEATIDGKAITNNKIYYVATSDYLYNNGDNMSFFQPNEGFFKINYKIRNAMIDHFKKIDTIDAKADDRFITLKD